MSVQIGLIVFLHYSLFQQQSYFHIYYLHSIINQQLFEFLAYIKRCCMGNKNQKVQENRQTFSSQIKHPKLSHAKVIKPHSQNQQPYLELAQSVQNRQIYEKWKLRAMKYSVDPSQIQMILIPRAILFEEKGICGSSGIIKSQYIMLPYVLSEEIDNRAILKQPFLEKQLWYLIYILNAAGSLAHSRGLILGDVRPENVLMSFDGQICVCCLETFLDQQKNYTKTMRLKMKTFLAPEQIKDLQEGKSQPATDQKISESFSIGLTILSAILLKDLTYLYGQDYTFNERSLQSQVSNMKNRTQYSQNLKSLVESLVQINPKQRLQSVEAVQILRPYEQEIINLEDFQLEKSTIPTQIKGKLKNAQNIGVRSGRNNQLSKVINNNDFNKNSRINYETRTNDLSKVINNNDFNKNSRVKYDVSPRMSNNALHQQVKFQFPTINGGKPQQLQFKAGNNYAVGSNPKQYNQKSNNQEPQIVLTQSLYTQIPHLNGFQQGQQLANNYSQIQTQRPIESKVIQSTSYNRPQLNGFSQRTDQVPITIQYPPVGTLPMHYVNKNQVQANQMFYQNPIQVTNSNVVHNLNQPYRIPSQISNQYLNVQGSNLNSMPVSGIASGIKTPEVFSYGSRFQSNIEDFEHPKQIIHKQQTKNVETYLSKPNSYYSKPQPEITINRQIHGNNSINTPTFPTRKLEQLGREVNSIRPPPDKIFQTYEQAMKNLDDKLKQSKTMFPDDP